jgi:hypothetical protein
MEKLLKVLVYALASPLILISVIPFLPTILYIYIMFYFVSNTDYLDAIPGEIRLISIATVELIWLGLLGYYGEKWLSAFIATLA